MLVPWKDLIGWNVTTTQCSKGAERRRRRLAEEETRESVERYFQAYGRPLATFTLFKYLGQVLTAAHDDWTAVVGNL